MAKNIVIVGAGYGGLRAALDLAALLQKQGIKDHEIILIDRREHHVFTPLLYKLATTKSYPEKALAYPIKDLALPLGFQFKQDEIKDIDILNGRVELARGEELKADYLVLAPGSEANYFGIQGLKEFSLPLKNISDAQAIRERLFALKPSSHVLIGGGGPTGVELAAEIRGKTGLKVSVLEAMPTLLPGFDPRLPKLAAKRLAKLGVNVITNTSIARVEEAGVETKEGEFIQADLIIWTGGVKPPEWIKGLPLKIEERGRIETETSMRCLSRSEELKVAPNVYALGDVACVYSKDGKPVPGVAPAAIEQGKVVAANILADITGKKHKEYSRKRYPYVLPVGGNYAIGTIGPFLARGIAASIFQKMIALDYWMSILPFRAAIQTWLEA